MTFSIDGFEWVVGYEGHYMVSRCGRVYSVKRGGRELSGTIDADGYLVVHLSVGGSPKKEKVHRLVASVYVPNPNGYDTINHIDGDKLNNDASNLEWCTPELNSSHAAASGLYRTGAEHPKAKVTDSEIAECIELYSTGNYTMKQLAELYGVHSGTIGKWLRGTNRLF